MVTVEPPPPNIILIVLDCARAKNFGTSGGGLIAPTPAIDSLATRGTSFPRAVAASNWTLPSHASLFTGKYPNEHGIRTYQVRRKLPETTAEFLQKSGYETRMFTENIQLIGEYGLERGFEQVRYNSREKGLANIFGVKRGRSSIAYSPAFVRLLSRIPPLIAPLSWTTRLQEVSFKREVCTTAMLDQFEAWLTERSVERPFFGFLNLLDTHNPYDLVSDRGPLGFLDKTYLYTPRAHMLLVPGLQSRLRWEPLVAGYAESITAADRKVGRLVSMLAGRGVLERTMIVVTSDHGQAFGEMGNVYHGAGATDSVTRVPLVVAAPEGVSLPRTIDRWVSLCEIDSWIRAAASGLAPFDSSGHAPEPFLTAAPDSALVFSEGPPVSDANRSMRGLGAGQFWSHRLLAAYRGEEKLVLDIDTGEILRWDKAADPDSTLPNRLTGDSARAVRREVFQAYEARDAAREAQQGPATPVVDIEIDERLRSWGYD
jgi:sulfatase-like protein